MDELLKELEEAACEWPENHRLARACRKGAEEIGRLAGGMISLARDWAECHSALGRLTRALELGNFGPGGSGRISQALRHALDVHRDTMPDCDIAAAIGVAYPASDAPLPPQLP